MMSSYPSNYVNHISGFHLDTFSISSMNHSNEFHLDKLLILLIDQSEAPREAEAQTHDMFEVTVSVTFVASVSQTDISKYRKYSWGVFY